MAEMFVYDADCEDFDNYGLCGALVPTSCVFKEEANGISEIMFEHPVDEYKRFSELLVDNIIKCDVPVRGLPKESDTAQVRYYYAKIKTTVTDRALYTTVKKKSKMLKTIPATQVESATSGNVDVKLYIMAIDAEKEMHNIRFTLFTYNKKKSLYIPKAYSGWVPSDSITTDESWYEDVTAGIEGIETIAPSWVVKPQLFRICNVEMHSDTVSVTAQHIFYDLLGTLATIPAWNETVSGRSAFKTVLGDATDFDVTSDITFGRAHAGFTDENIVSAFLNADTGLCGWYGANIYRDNFSFALLRDTGYPSGTTVEYGKNLLGLKQTIDSSGVIDCVRPVGQTKKGDKLYLAFGDYETERYRVHVDDDLCVYAGDVTDLNDEPVFPDFTASTRRHRYMFDLGDSVKETANTAAATLAARNKLVDAAVDYLTDTKCYTPAITLDIDFLNIGDTAEYAHLRELTGVHLYDIVTLKHRKLGITAIAQVTRIEYDVLLDKMNSMSLGTLNIAFGAEKIGASQIPDSTRSSILAAASKPNAGFKTSVTLWSNLWDENNTQTVAVTGMDANIDLIVAPVAASTKAYSKAGIYCSAQGDGTLTFTCATVPTANIPVNITILGGLVQW